VNGGENMKVKLKDTTAFEKLIAESGFTKNSLSTKIGRERSCVYVITKRGKCGPETANLICKTLGVNFYDIFLLEMPTKVSKRASYK